MSTTVSTQAAFGAPAVQQEPRAVAEFKIAMGKMGPEFLKLLPPNIKLDAFQRILLTACQSDPYLLQADRSSLFRASLRAAQDGLLPDGRQAALVVFNAKNKRTNTYEKKVAYVPMVEGIILKLRQCGYVISAHVVYAGDAFDFELGDNERIYHKPTLVDRGAAIGAYAIAKDKEGNIWREVMSFADIEKVRNTSKQADGGFWTTWWDQMARKTVIKRLAKHLPLNSESLQSIYDDDAQDAEPSEIPTIAQPKTPEAPSNDFAAAPSANTPEAAPTPAEPPKRRAPPIVQPRSNGAPKAEQAAPSTAAPDAPAATIDAETGEILGPEGDDMMPPLF